MIDYTGHPSGGKLEERINELINEPVAAAPKEGDKVEEKAAAGAAPKSSLGVDSWSKFQKILTNPPAIKNL